MALEEVGDVAMADEQHVLDSSRQIDSMDVPIVSKTEPVPSAVAFSWSKAKSSSSRPPKLVRNSEAATEEGEFLTEFDGKARATNKQTIVIPKQENTWRPEKRMKNIICETDLEKIEEGDRFEMEKASEEGPQHQYGLTIVRKKLDIPDANNDDNKSGFVDLELQRFKQDIESLPDEASVEAYENIPVEEFGKALLRGMGWEAGKPIGRNSKVAVAPIEHTRRYGRDGLGAVPAPRMEKGKYYTKPGETRGGKPSVGKIVCIKVGAYVGLRGQIVEIRDTSYTLALLKGGERISIMADDLAELESLDEEKAIRKLKELNLERDVNASLQANGSDREACTESTRHKRHDLDEDERRNRRKGDKYYQCREEKKDERTTANYVRKANDEEDKHARRADTKDRRETDGKSRKDKQQDADKEGRNQRGEDDPQHTRHGERRKDKHRKHERGDKYTQGKSNIAYDNEGKDENQVKSESGNSMAEAGKFVRNGQLSLRSWLFRDIRVRIVDKKLYEGRLYLKKGHIVDVVSPLVCDVLMDETGELVQDVNQAFLETALPKKGGSVLAVGSEHRGRLGKLQDRDSEKGVGIVQFVDELDVVSLGLDNLAEYTGNTDEMEL